MPGLVGGFGKYLKLNIAVSILNLLLKKNYRLKFLLPALKKEKSKQSIVNKRNLNSNQSLPGSKLEPNGAKVVGSLSSNAVNLSNSNLSNSNLSNSNLSNSNLSNSNLGPYLAGLIEGDGTIVVHDPNSTVIKYSPKIIVVFKKADLRLADYLRDLTNCGQVLIKRERGYVL
jgi:hypothetical protein